MRSIPSICLACSTTNAQLNAFVAFLRHRRQVSEHKPHVPHAETRKPRYEQRKMEIPKDKPRYEERKMEIPKGSALTKTWATLKGVMQRVVGNFKSGFLHAKHVWTKYSGRAPSSALPSDFFLRKTRTLYFTTTTAASARADKRGDHVTARINRTTTVAHEHTSSSGAMQSQPVARARFHKGGGPGVAGTSPDGAEKKNNPKNKKERKRGPKGVKRRPRGKKRGREPDSKTADQSSENKDDHGDAATMDWNRKSATTDLKTQSDLQRKTQEVADLPQQYTEGDDSVQMYETGVLDSDDHGGSTEGVVKRDIDYEQAKYDEDTVRDGQPVHRSE